MKHSEARDVRTFALIGHGGCGKTSIGDAILFLSGANTRLGKVDDRSSVLDHEPEEQERGHSLSAHFASVDWDGRRLHVVDTPGDGNFVYEAWIALHGVDTAVLVVSAVDGVEVGTEKTWGFATELGLPRVVFVNKVDRERADPAAAVKDVEEGLGVRVVPLQVPIGREAGFRGVVDLVRQKALIFAPDGGGRVTEEAIPESLAAEVRAATEAMMDAAASADDELIEKFLEAGELTEDELRVGLAKGIAQGAIVPALFGSATANAGVAQLLDLTSVLPGPLGAAARTAHRGDEEVRVPPDPTGPFVGLVIKTFIDPFAGKVNVFRVLSGTVAADAPVLNSGKGVRERLAHLSMLRGKKQEPIDRATVGDVVAVAKLRETATLDTLCDESAALRVPPPPIPQPMMSYVVRPKSKGDEDKVKGAILKLLEEDPNLHIGHDELTKEIVLSGMGQQHIEINVKRLRRKYGVDVELDLPLVPYKETIKGSVRVQGRHKKQTGGRGQFADTWMRVEPLPRGGGFEFVDEIVGGAVPRQYIPAVEKGVRETMARGVLAGYPVVDVRVTLDDGGYHAVDSSEMAFKTAASKGFKKGFLDCRPTLLEPIYDLDVLVPEESVGDIMGDINGRRGRVITMENRGRSTLVKAQVPLAELLTYAPDLRSITGGKGSFTMSLSHNEEVPPHLLPKLVAESKRKVEEEED